MNKFLLSNLVLALTALSSSIVGYADVNCADLSHIKIIATKISTYTFHHKQVGCDKQVQFQIVDGESMELFTQEIKADWTESKVDDEYELTTNKNRTMWSTDQQTLLHEYVIESLDKKTGDKRFSSASIAYSLEDSKVLESGFELERVETKETGKVEVKSKQYNNLLDRLSQ